MKNINLFTFLWKFLKNKKSILLFWIFLELLSEFLGIFVAQYFNKQAINYFQVKSPIFKYGLFLIILYVIFNDGVFLISILKIKFRKLFCDKIANDIRESAFNYTIQHSMNYFNNSFSGDISSKISNLGRNYSKLLNVLRVFIISSTIFIFVVIFYLKINIYLSILFLFFSAIYFFVYAKYSIEYSKTSKEKSDAVSNYFGFIIDVFTNIRNVKIFSNYKFERFNSKKAVLNVMRKEKMIYKTQTKLQLVNFIATFCLIFSVICISSILLSQHKIGFGDFVAIVIILSISRFILTKTIKNLNWFYGLKGSIQSSIEKIYQPIEIKDNKNDILNVSNGKIIFKNVIFYYD